MLEKIATCTAHYQGVFTPAISTTRLAVEGRRVRPRVCSENLDLGRGTAPNGVCGRVICDDLVPPLPSGDGQDTARGFILALSPQGRPD